jgi:hypothetical protein
MTVLSADATYAAPASESQGAAEFPAALLALMGFAGLVGMVRFGRRIG